MKLSSLVPSAIWRVVKPALTQNVGLKIFSLACSIALWLFVHGAQEAQRVVAVGLVVLPPPASQNKILTTVLPSSVTVILHGPKSVVEELRASDLAMQLDLRSGISGNVPLLPEMLGVPGRVTVDVIEPSSVNIAWDDEVERRIQIQVPITGAPADGFVMKGRPSVVPDSLVAGGPGQVVASLHVVRTDTFDITGLPEGLHSRMLVVERPLPRVGYDVVHARASVEIVRKVQQRTFSNVPVRVVGISKAVVEPSHIDVNVDGALDHVNNLRVEQIVPRVSVSEAEAAKKSNSIVLPVEIKLDEVHVTLSHKDVVVKW
ncbi:MAG: hypothetical protein FWD57_08655 [Polyangiaceae bacterium]|nr:hypothetical protein [Polyangiaceae bacterium]